MSFLFNNNDIYHELSFYGLIEKEAALHVPLRAAIKKNDIKGIKEALQRGADINYEPRSNSEYDYYNSYDRGMPLYYALFHKASQETIRFLLEQGANPNPLQCGQRWSPLQYAVTSGDIEIVKLLIDFGASVNEDNNHTGIALFQAMDEKLLPIARLLIQSKSNVNLNIQQRGIAPIDEACYTQSTQLVKLLLENNAFVTRNSLLITIKSGDVEILNTLLSFDPYAVNSKLHDNKTPLHLAVESEMKNKNEVIQCILIHNPNLSLTDDLGISAADKVKKVLNDWTPEMPSLLWHVIHQMVSNMLKMNIMELQNFAKQLPKDTPHILHMVQDSLAEHLRISFCPAPVVDLLYKAENYKMANAGNSENDILKMQSNQSNQTKLSYLNAARFLVMMGTDVNRVNDYGQESALEIACSQNLPEFVELLLSRRADTNHASRHAVPIWYAQKNPILCKMLLVAGVNLKKPIRTYDESYAMILDILPAEISMAVEAQTSVSKPILKPDLKQDVDTKLSIDESIDKSIEEPIDESVKENKIKRETIRSGKLILDCIQEEANSVYYLLLRIFPMDIVKNKCDLLLGSYLSDYSLTEKGDVHLQAIMQRCQKSPLLWAKAIASRNHRSLSNVPSTVSVINSPGIQKK